MITSSKTGKALQKLKCLFQQTFCFFIVFVELSAGISCQVMPLEQGVPETRAPHLHLISGRSGSLSLT
jgi:hypothetical protein